MSAYFFDKQIHSLSGSKPAVYDTQQALTLPVTGTHQKNVPPAIYSQSDTVSYDSENKQPLPPLLSVYRLFKPQNR